ncbi:hypothetical protein DL93DRAFT_2134844 [Clavulina sp. PMI_390]|nr:hypothetical protein DL93DRAFT_2134844 [Clavulina sp. PMI_390]
MLANSYAPPEPPLLIPANPRNPSYVPLQYPPEIPASSLPNLPSAPRKQSSLPPALARNYKLTTHIVTAAWPRLPSQLFDPAAYEAPQGESRVERRARVNKVYDELDQSRILADRGEGPERNEVLYNVVNRYRRKGKWVREGGEGGITLFVTHAVGFPKEIWEQTLAKLVEQTEHSAHGTKINEIWAFESYNHGDSALINEGKLGTMNCFEDTTRDILNFMLNYLPHNAGANHRDLPVHLTRLPREIAEGRRILGYAGDRTVVGLGHSAGAAAMITSAVNEPALFHSLVAIEPIIIIKEFVNEPIFRQWRKGAIGRRAHWDSREDALSLYKLSPSFSYWNPDVLKTFVKYGITEDSKGGVKLKTPTMQEAMWFMEGDGVTKTYETLSQLPPSVELLLLYSSRSAAGTGGEISTRHVAHRRPKNTRNMKLDSSHLMVQESPQLVANTVFDFLQEKYTRAVLPSSGGVVSQEASLSLGARL